jgi:hypothetical protein
MTTIDASTMFDDYASLPGTPEAEKGLERDRWDRPLIIQPDTGELVPYTRMSTMASMLDNHAGLHTWEKRLLARGLGMSPDLVGMLAGVPPISGNKRLDSTSNAFIDPIIERALDRSGRDVKADYGTAVHALTDPGTPREYAPTPEMADDVAAYDHAMRTATQTMSEVFVVNDRLKCAGTFDGVYDWLGIGEVLGDKKTGKLKFVDCAIQLAGYRTSAIYDPYTGERTPLPATLSEDWLATIHVPYGEKRCDVWFLDREIAGELLELAAQVRDARAYGNKGSRLYKKIDPIAEAEAYIGREIEAAKTVGDLQHLWDRTGHLWTDAHKAQATAKGQR